ncbi:MAG: hypothetical protein KDE63_10355 [Novosphingobium sp.]|nr:hypothetical protein [Novosphingobium sp.]
MDMHLAEISSQVAPGAHAVLMFDLSRASALRHDAVWLLENFASRAFRDGWTVGELFGFWPDKPGWGGIADRLDGSRSLKMTADRAHWRCVVTGDVRQFNRGAYGDLKSFLSLKIT